MFPSETARHLRKEFRRDAVHVDDLGLRETADQQVASVARAEDRAMVTENVADYAREPDLALVCVLKQPARRWRPGPGLGQAARTWCRANPRRTWASTGRREQSCRSKNETRSAPLG